MNFMRPKNLVKTGNTSMANGALMANWTWVVDADTTPFFNIS
jgi:hypothetical protein